MLRIKDEARWIKRVLHSLLPVCERIYIMDDSSTDDTVEICRSVPKVEVFASPFTGTQETRDKNWLMEKVDTSGASWVVAIDGDEEIAPGGCEEILRIAKNGDAHAFRFQVLYLWDREDQVRVDGIYQDFRRPSMFRLVPGARFTSHVGGGFHCGNIPSSVKWVESCNVKLLHYGYLHKEDRLRKYAWYNAEDKQPLPPLEDGYRHMVIGDLLPAEAMTRWAGPLQLAPLQIGAVASHS